MSFDKEIFIKSLCTKSKSVKEIEKSHKVQGIYLATLIADTDCIDFDSFTFDDLQFAMDQLYSVDDVQEDTLNPIANYILLDKVKEITRKLKSLYLPTSEDFF